MSLWEFWKYHKSRERILKGNKYNVVIDFIKYFGGLPFRFIKYKRGLKNGTNGII